jgi:F-type H+-transporting ATPase subunit a
MFGGRFAMIMPFFGFEVEPLGAQGLFNVGPLTITNTMLTGVVVGALLIIVFLRAARISQLSPKSKLAFYIESIVELVLGLLIELFGDREKAMRYFPFLLTLFVFILACNLTGILPGIESISYFHGGQHTSLFRAWTTDLNSTAALAVLTMVTVQVHAIRSIGSKGYFQHFFTHQPWKPMNLFVGLLDVFGEVMRLVTLALRLFGVIYGGEALLFAIAATTGNFGWAGMIPIVFLEIFFCFVQAYLFMMLSASYLVMSTSMHEQESHSPSPVAELSGAKS